MKQRIFVGSSREALAVSRAVQSELDDADFEVTVWNQGVFRPSRGALESLLEALESSDAGIFVLRKDDLTTSRGVSEETVRDNVIFELGMFIGKLGRDRSFMLSPQGDSPSLPSDFKDLTRLEYEAGRIDREGRAAVGSACNAIRSRLGEQRGRVVEDSPLRRRLDRAMKRLSRDLEWLLAGRAVPSTDGDDSRPVAEIPIAIGRATVHVEFGRIEEYEPHDDTTVVALPANEYFDEDCVMRANSSLGAYVQHHFASDLTRLLAEIRAELHGKPSERVPRTDSRIEDSYGIGQAIYLRELAPEHRVILVSATTDRAGIGLRAEPHFLYAAIHGVIEAMNENQLRGLVMPVLGAGHGAVPLTVALLFNLLALRSTLADESGDKVRDVRIVVFQQNAGDVTDDALREVISRVASP
jgi:O-acetyl-ADP-ribose deacetylase (regulator of RNase III)